MNNRLGLIIALLALGVMSAFAALQFTNVTQWAINATKPPVEKIAGADAATYPNNIMVKSYVDPSTGLNVTYIYVLGYTGDITNYTDALRVCYYSASSTSSATVWIQYVGPVGYTPYSNYVKQFVVYRSNIYNPNVAYNPNAYNPNTGPWVGFTYTGTTVYGPVQVAMLGPNTCVVLGVSVLVSGNLPPIAWSSSVGTAVPPTNYLAIYQVNIQMLTSQ